jgi:hypothetical protein
MPAKAGIQDHAGLDSGLRRHDEVDYACEPITA